MNTHPIYFKFDFKFDNWFRPIEESWESRERLNFKPCSKCKHRFYNKLIRSPVICLEDIKLNKKRHCDKYRPNEFIISRRKIKW
jgi:hypothetical protein